MSKRAELVELLACGEFRSGQWLGERLAISRAAVWKHIRSLEASGLEVHAVRGRGYRLVHPFEPLDQRQIRESIPAGSLALLDSLDVLHVTDSTSDFLKRKPVAALAEDGRARVCLAEWQTAGRGRRGRRWVSPYGSNLYLSLSTRVGANALASGGLSLAVAVAVLNSLQSCGVPGLGLKWPNDIYFEGRKLAGILLDLTGESGGPYQVIAGVGLNLGMPGTAGREIDQPWADLSQTGVKIDRNRLAGVIIGELLKAMELYDKRGLDAFAGDWRQHDLASGQPVELRHEQRSVVKGVARGIDAHGALLVESDGVTRGYHAGELSLRLT